MHLLCKEDEATVVLEESEVSVDEDGGTAMFCANLTLTAGYTLETTVIAPFDVSAGDTGIYHVAILCPLYMCNRTKEYLISTKMQRMAMTSSSKVKTFVANGPTLMINSNFPQRQPFVLVLPSSMTYFWNFPNTSKLH